MEQPFIGRKRELHLLMQLQKKKSASLVVLRGRRRIGKSRLAQEFAKGTRHHFFAGLPPTRYTSADEQRKEFARQLQRELNIPLPQSDDWGDLFWHLAQQLKTGQTVLILDEISWMGSKDPTFLGKLKTAWDLYFKTNPQLILILCGSLSSWIEENILSSTGFMGRISLDLILEELTLAECNQFWFSAGDRASDFDKFKVLAVTGGVPRYLEEILPNQSAESNIERLCFQREGCLFSEFGYIFSDLFSARSSTYQMIVKRLADGPCTLQDIYEALAIQKSGVISEYMEDLISAGFVSHEFTWSIKTGHDSKLAHYRLKDNYLRFYLKYISPHSKTIERQALKLPVQWKSIMGLQFENLVLSNRKSLQKLLNIDPVDIINDNPFFQRKTTRQAGCQIDYMIQNRFGTCYVCEIKFNHRRITRAIVDEMKEKISRLSLPKGISIRPVLIHVNGVDDRVLEDDFFSNIVDFSDLLRAQGS